jgi:integrase
MIALTDRQIRAIKSPAVGRVELVDSLARGLTIRVTARGVRTWVVRYVKDGRQRRHTLGHYPAVTLADARRLAERLRGDLAHDRDPAAERAAARLQAAAADTFADLARLYVEKHAKAHKRSWREDDRIIRTELLPRWRHHRVRELRRADIRAVVERIGDRAPIMANRTLAVVSRMLNWALERDWIEANPAYRISRPGKEQSRDRVLSPSELRELWVALGETERRDDLGRPVARLSATLNAAFRMRLLTAQRGGEVFQMRWADVDIASGWWSIPGELTKNREPHRVPLVGAAWALLAELLAAAPAKAVWVFGGEAGRNVAHRGKKAASFLCRGDGHIQTARSRNLRRPRFLAGLSFAFRGHDLRRTAASGMAEAGVPREHISRVLNHVDSGPRATRVYDRYAYDREKRRALEAWERLLDAQCGSQRTTANVLPFTGT